MEAVTAILIPALLGLFALRLMFFTASWGLRLGIHAGCGLLCLYLLNTVSGITGIFFPVNAVTVFTAGVLGIPGIGLLTLLELTV